MKKKADEQGVVFVWGDDGSLFEADAVRPAPVAPVTPSPSLDRDPIAREIPASLRVIPAEDEKESAGHPRQPAVRRCRQMPQVEAPAAAGDEGVERVPFDSLFSHEERSKKGTREKRRRAPQEKPSLNAQAIGYLSRREYSRKELRSRLSRANPEVSAEEIDECLKRLESLGYVSDERFAAGRARVRAQQLGNRRIRGELRQLGVSEETVRNALDEIQDSEEVRAYRVWRKRFRELPDSPKERDRQIRYLLYRGFSMSSINQVIRGKVEDPDAQGFWD